jgi:hypothetical protein
MDKNKIIRNIYYLIKRLFNALSAFFRELFKPIAFLKGDDFEKCLRKKVFTKANYELVMKTHDFHENNKDYVESSLYPDYLFRDKKSNKEFFVEAKYRENLYQGKVNWCKDYQFKRYKRLDRETPVIIAIGLGSRPDNPSQIFLVPLDKIEYSSLYPKFLDDYEFEEKRKNLLDGLMDKVYDHSKTR